MSGDSSPLVAVLNGIFYANPPRTPLSESKVTEVAGSMPWSWAIPTQLGDSFRGFPVIGTTPAFLDDFEPAMGEPWRIRRPGRNIEGPFDVVLGSRVAAATGLGVGDRLHGHADDPFALARVEVRGDMEPDDLFETLAQSLLAAVDRDALSGWGGVVHIITPEGITTKTLKGRQD